MNLKFICQEDFEIADEVCARIQGYLPNLIHDIEVIRANAFSGIFYTWEILPKIERTIEPDWENDIVLVVIQGELHFADLELYDEVASTLDYFILKQDGTTRLFSNRPKIGGHFLPNNMSKELRKDIEYWTKLGAEEILHYFGVPEQHDENCFFHSKEYGKATLEDSKKDYCPKCRKFMLQLAAPLDFAKLSARVEEIYKLKPKPKRMWKGILRGLLRQGGGFDKGNREGAGRV